MTADHAAGYAFDALAASYDEAFTRTRVGEAQRAVVLEEAFRIFAGRHKILEINCGTGEDALHFAAKGWEVLALDASKQMISFAQLRKEREAPYTTVQFQHLPTEEIGNVEGIFDQAFSNFSGLNCVRNPGKVAALLADKTAPGASLVLCLSTRFCIWETMWYLFQAKPRKAFRRWSGMHRTSLQGRSLDVFYWSLPEIRRMFEPYFSLRSVRAIGLFVPPSYVESWVSRHPGIFAAMIRLDRFFSRVLVLRALGDHMLLHFEKVERAIP